MYENEDIYQGRYVKGEKQGEGRYLWKSGPCKEYSGFLKESLMAGEGCLVMASGERVTGKFDCSEEFRIERARFEYQGFSYSCSVENGRILSGFSV